MRELHYSDPPEPERPVHLEPRGWRRGEAVAPEDRAPYPWWFTVPFRVALAGFEIYVLVYIAGYHQQMQAQGKSSSAEIVLTGVGLAVVLDLLVALLASIAGAWEADGSCCGAFLDVIPGVLCVVGAVFVMWRESLPDDPLRGPRQTAGDLGFAVCAIHFAASLGGCIGCCITCGRRNAAKTAKKAAASGCACAHGTATAPSDTSATAPPPPYEAHHEEGAKGTDNADGVLHIDEPAPTHDRKSGCPAKTVEEV